MNSQRACKSRLTDKGWRDRGGGRPFRLFRSIVRLAIDPDEHLVEVSSPMGKSLMMLDALLPYSLNQEMHSLFPCSHSLFIV